VTVKAFALLAHKVRVGVKIIRGKGKGGWNASLERAVDLALIPENAVKLKAAAGLEAQVDGVETVECPLWVALTG
jgi:hypothetical protein